ncbi:uncharacterized protein G2W53_007563 [Senna tora]|uniref:Uncharacterized protein n=1 Tax=Senna tora TaxID=362788 RepID=A0A835CDT1_9FABA|nr:uncharacterized protein G2W53_007563 [Senna tora]
MGGASIMSKHIPDDKSWSDLRNIYELRGKRLVAQVSQTRRFALYLRTGVVLMLQLESSWHGSSVVHVLTYSGRQIAVGSQKPSQITGQKTCCASESNTSVRVVFANRSGFDATIGVVLAWEERGSCLNIFRTTNRGQISKTFMNYEARDLLRDRLGMGGAWIMSQHIQDDKSRSDLRNLHELRGKRLVAHRGSCLNIFRTTNRGRISETFTNYGAKDLFASESNTSVHVVFANWSGFDAPIGVVITWEERGSCLNIFRMTNRSRILETFTNYEAKDLLRKSVRIVFANRSGFDAPIGVVLAWEEGGSWLKIFRTTNRGQISETFTNYEAKDLLRKSVDHILTYSGRQITVRSQKYSRITRQKTCCASESNTSVRVVLMLQWESSWHVWSEDHVLTYSGRQITVGSQKPSRITGQKTCCASESNTSVRVVLSNRSGFDAPIGVVLAWEERGSCLNISRTKSRGRISETFTNYEAKDFFRNESYTSVRVVFANRSGFDAPIGVVLAWEEGGSCLNIFQMTNRGRTSETFTNYRAKDLLRKRKIAVGSQKPSQITGQNSCCASKSNTSVRVVFANRSGFDAPIGVVLAWEERGSCLNKLRSDLINLHELRGKRVVAQMSQTRRFALYLRTGLALMLQLESSWHGRSVDHVLTYSGRQITKPSRITRQKSCCASESNTSVRVVFANRSGFDAPIGVFMAWEECGSCLNILRMTNRGRISETFMNYEAKDLLRNESNTSVRVVFANQSGFNAPIAVVLAWEERGSCLSILWTTNPGQISETFMNYEEKDLLRNESNTSVHVEFANRSGLDAPIGVVMAWEERGSCINIFRTTSRGQISETFMNYESTWHGRSVDHVLTYSGCKIAVGSQKPSRITRQKTCCASRSNTSIHVVFANRSGFVAPIGVVFAWEERGSCLNIFRTKNWGQISETFTNYEAKELSRKSQKPSRIMRQKTCSASETNTSVRVGFVNRSGFDAPIAVFLAWEERGSCLNIFRTKNHGQISETFTNYEAKDLFCK